MRLSVLLTSLCLATGAGRIWASPQCMMVALRDTHAIEDPSATWKRGTRNGPVTEYVVNERTGVKSFCLHGGYCYLATVNVGGQSFEALRLTNCRIQPGSASRDGDEVSYGVEGVPAQRPAQQSQPDGVHDIQALSGQCAAKSFTANGPIGTDISDEEMRFSCNAAALFFMDDQNKRIVIRFIDSDHVKDAPMLGFAGEMDGDGKTLHVQGMEFLEPGSKAVAVLKDSNCGIGFHGSTLSTIDCFATFADNGIKYVAYVSFRATADQ